DADDPCLGRDRPARHRHPHPRVRGGRRAGARARRPAGRRQADGPERARPARRPGPAHRDEGGVRAALTGRLTLAVLVVAALRTVAVVGGMVRFMDPFPPRRIVMATGQIDSVYDAFGRQYQSRLAREGLRVDLFRTAGSVENLDRLLSGQVDVAFVQGGTYQVVSDPE